MPLERDGPQFPAYHKTRRVTHASRSQGFNILEDVVTMDTHSGTHIDALGHVWAGDQFYNGFTEDQVFQSGVVIGGIEKVSSMVGRGIMLDVPSYRNVDHMGPGVVVTGGELDAIAAHQGTEVRQGDIVMIRTGWERVFYTDRTLWESAIPCPDSSVAGWLEEKDICALWYDLLKLVYMAPSPSPSSSSPSGFPSSRATRSPTLRTSAGSWSPSSTPSPSPTPAPASGTRPGRSRRCRGASTSWGVTVCRPLRFTGVVLTWPPVCTSTSSLH